MGAVRQLPASEANRWRGGVMERWSDGVMGTANLQHSNTPILHYSACLVCASPYRITESVMTTLISCSTAIRFSRRAGWLTVLLMALSATVAVAEESHVPPTPGSALPPPPKSLAGKPPWG